MGPMCATVRMCQPGRLDETLKPKDTTMTNATTTDMKFANHYGWSDVNPYEIVRVISGKTLEVREMQAERDESWKPDFVPGGFFGTVVNQNQQRWTITSDPTSPVIRIRLGKDGWKDKHGKRFGLAAEPRKFYDYNF